MEQRKNGTKEQRNKVTKGTKEQRKKRNKGTKEQKIIPMSPV